MKDIVEQFQSLSAKEIRAQRPGQCGDFELLDVLQYFTEGKKEKQTTAVIELILRSPEHGEMVAYDQLYFDVMEMDRQAGNFAAALRWAHAGFAYGERRAPDMNRANRYRDLAETYLYAGDFDTGLTIMARCLEADPDDVITYNVLALTLPHVGLSRLAVEVLEQGLSRVTQADPEELRDQFEELHREAQAKAAQEPDRTAEVDTAVLAQLHAAMQATTGHPDGMGGYLAPVDRLITAASDDNALYDDILAQGKALIPDLIRIAFDESLGDTPAPGHAVTLLRQLHAAKTAELGELAHWLARADGNWRTELLTEKMGKISGYTTGELETIAADASYYLYVRTGASDALVERAQKCPEQRQRIIDFMRSLLTRPEAGATAAEETFIGFLIADIGDFGAAELYPEIEAAYREDRVDLTIIDLPFVQEQLGQPVTPPPERREDGLYLNLLCKKCGREREHFVQHVTLDTGTQERKSEVKPIPYDAYVMDREIVCPKCGARDRYEVTPQASLRLMMPAGGLEGLVQVISGKKDAPFEFDPRVHRFKSVVFGRPMHPLVGLDKYRSLVAARPRDASLHFRMGNLLRTLWRGSQTLAAYRKGHELEPDNPEYTCVRAMAEHDFGDAATAKALYEETIALASKQLWRDPDMIELTATAHQGLELLKRGKESPWQPDVIEKPKAPRPSRQQRRPKRKKRKRRR